MTSLNVLFPSDTKLLKEQVQNKIQDVTVCKGQYKTRIPENEPRPFPSSDVIISCTFPCKHFWQSGRYHSFLSCPKARVTHTSVQLSDSLLFVHVCFSLQSYGWVSPSEKVGLIVITLHSCSPDDAPLHSSEKGTGLKTKGKWWCTSIQGMCNKINVQCQTTLESVQVLYGDLKPCLLRSIYRLFCPNTNGHCLVSQSLS